MGELCAVKVARTVRRGLCLREGTRLPYLNFANFWSELTLALHLFRPKISKVKTSIVSQILQVSNTLTPSEGVSDYTPV